MNDGWQLLVYSIAMRSCAPLSPLIASELLLKVYYLFLYSFWCTCGAFSWLNCSIQNSSSDKYKSSCVTRFDQIAQSIWKSFRRKSEQTWLIWSNLLCDLCNHKDIFIRCWLISFFSLRKLFFPAFSTELTLEIFFHLFCNKFPCLRDKWATQIFHHIRGNKSLKYAFVLNKPDDSFHNSIFRKGKSGIYNGSASNRPPNRAQCNLPFISQQF